MTDEAPEPLSPAEQRVRALLAPFREEQAPDGEELTRAVSSTARWREMAREVSARRYVEGAFAVGEEVSVNGARGRIAAIEATGTVLETSGGDRVRVPNSQLVASIVTLHAEAPEPQRP
jgi:hypothetical protein